MESDYRWWFQLRRGRNIVPSWVHSHVNDLSSYWGPSLCLCYPILSPPLCPGCVWTPFWSVIIDSQPCRLLTLFSVEHCLGSSHLRQGSHPRCWLGMEDRWLLHPHLIRLGGRWRVPCCLHSIGSFRSPVRPKECLRSGSRHGKL